MGERAVARAIDLALRAHSSPRTRRVVPVGVPFGLADRYAAWARRTRDTRWERFRAFHERLLAHTPLAGTEEDVAERACAEMIRTAELYWRPWLMARTSAEGVERLRAARAEGRGVAAVFTHFGIPYAQFPLLGRLGVDAYAITGAFHFDDPADTYAGRFARQGRAHIEQLGPGRALVAGQAFDPALALLRRGATVSIAFDLVGSTPTPFLGRTVQLASGASRLPFAAGAMVVPFVCRRAGHLPVVRFGEPIDAREHADAVSLQASVAAVMERWALERPEAVWPLEFNGTPLV